MLTALLPALAITLLTTALTLRWARRALVDQPNERSLHRLPTPRGGGIGLLAGIAAGATAAPVTWHPWLALPILGIALLSFADDLNQLSVRVRLSGHLILAGLAVALLGNFNEIAITPITTITATPLLMAMTVLWIVGLTNIYNFLDGIDGIAAVQAVVAGAAWSWLGTIYGLDAVRWCGAIIAAAALGFLPFNWPPARIFLGDVGSATLGTCFALLPLLASRSGADAWAAPVGVLVVWPFLFDSGFTLVRRARRSEHLFEAHRSHLYQRLVIAGWSHRQTTLLYGGLALLTSLAAVQVAAGRWWFGWIAALVTGLLQVGLTWQAEGEKQHD